MPSSMSVGSPRKGVDRVYMPVPPRGGGAPAASPRGPTVLGGRAGGNALARRGRGGRGGGGGGPGRRGGAAPAASPRGPTVLGGRAGGNALARRGRPARR